MDPNIIVTYDPTHASNASEEVKELLDFTKFDFLESGFEGTFLIKTKGDPKEIIKKLTKMCSEEPYKFKFTFRWIPVDIWCASKTDDISEILREFNSNIADNESWKMDVGKRGYEGDTMELIMKLTESINRPNVDLKNPDKIVKIEIVGDRAGVSLLNKDEYLNIAKAKTF